MANIKTNLLDKIADYDVQDFPFSAETLTCKQCNNMYDKTGFGADTLKTVIIEYLVQQSISDVRYLRKSAYKNSKPIKITCKSCLIKCSNQLKCRICKNTYLVEKFCIEKGNEGREAICKKCVDNNLESEIKSTENHFLKTDISTLSDSATLNKQMESIKHSLVPDFSQPCSNTALLNTIIDELQLKMKGQTQPQFSKNLNASKLNTSIYSLLQLSGRKNPPPSNSKYNHIKSLKEYENKYSSSTNIRKNEILCSPMLHDNGPVYEQNNIQNCTEISSEVKDYVLQFVDSIYRYSNRQKNESDLYINQTTSNYQSDASSCDETQLSEINNNQDHLYINTSTTRNDADIELVYQDYQDNSQEPSNISSTYQLKHDIGNSYSKSSSSNDHNSDITIGSYRNKNFNLKEAFGKSYSPYPIPLFQNTNKSTKEKYQQNYYKSRASTDNNIRRRSNSYY
jgi:hypothetical protein